MTSVEPDLSEGGSLSSRPGPDSGSSGYPWGNALGIPESRPGH